MVPDLVVEVASSDQLHPEMEAKARLYLELGVPLVWVVWPAPCQVDVWRVGQVGTGAAEAPTTLAVSATLVGGDVLPGFAYPLEQLFAAQ